MDANTPPAEELLKKIQELEAGHAQMKDEMSRLKLSNDSKSETTHQRSHSVSPRRSRLAGRTHEAAAAALKKNSATFRHSSPLQRESRTEEIGSQGGGSVGVGNRGPSAVNFTDRQYLNILQSMGQAVHIFDLGGRIIYW